MAARLGPAWASATPNAGVKPNVMEASREVLDQLERIVDRFDDAANEIEGIVIEHV